MESLFTYLQDVIYTSLALFWEQESKYASVESIPLPELQKLSVLTGDVKISSDELIIVLLALAPHIAPQLLDIFFVNNKTYDRPYTEFGGWKGGSHGGFLPTGETAAFLLSSSSLEKRQQVMELLGKEHWFYKKNILRLEGQGEGEPFFSGKLSVTDEALAKLLSNGKYHPDYSISFPAKRITTPLEWKDLVLPYHLTEEVENILFWLKHQQDIRQKWKLDKRIKTGYRCLFYGPPGTGKTLTASLIGKHSCMDIYRVDLSMIVSKYIGETEKNLAKVFDHAEHQSWILFFDEADALFGQRTENQTSNDRHANQEVAYLLQRIEDFSGMVILATNLKDSIDEAFFRRFQSALYFPMPDQQLRYQLWKKMLPPEWLAADQDRILDEVATYALSGGSMLNIIQSCAIALYRQNRQNLGTEIFREAIHKELLKEGSITT